MEKGGCLNKSVQMYQKTFVFLRIPQDDICDYGQGFYVGTGAKQSNYYYIRFFFSNSNCNNFIASLQNER